MLIHLLLAAPVVGFSPGGGPRIVGVNNPEQLYNSDLSDNNLGSAIIYRDRPTQGAQRCWWEHVNRTGGTIGYAVFVENVGRSTVQVVVHGKTQSTGFLGGKPFADLFTNYSVTGTTYSVAPKSRVYIARFDSSVTNSTFFSGVVDYDLIGPSTIGTPVNVDVIAYRSFSRVTGTRTELGYVQRIESDGTHEARVYKGSSNYSQVRADNLNFTFGDSDPVGPMSVQVQTYNLTTKQFNPLSTRSYWFSNIGPGQNADCSASDMVSWAMRGFGTITPFAPSDGEGKYPNFGNWGITYILAGSFTNLGTRSRDVAFSLQAPGGGGSPIAYRGTDGVWRNTKMNAGASFDYYTASVPAGQSVPFEARYILGGPGAGSLLNRVSLKN